MNLNYRIYVERTSVFHIFDTPVLPEFELISVMDSDTLKNLEEENET